MSAIGGERTSVYATKCPMTTQRIANGKVQEVYADVARFAE